MNLIEQLRSTLAHLGAHRPGSHESAPETPPTATERRVCRRREPRVIFGVQGMLIPPLGKKPWWSDDQAR